ncbi:hypothetical protein RSX31_19950 [Rossellomorea sp. YC4-1]|jgi:lipid-A-disaccharide synthase-like uncharacterized protein|nr:hypothetical protein [Rossellomorea sp. YC4-1]
MCFYPFERIYVQEITILSSGYSKQMDAFGKRVNEVIFMQRWYFPFLVGIFVFIELILIGKQDLSFILTYSAGIFLGFLVIYLFRRKREN